MRSQNLRYPNKYFIETGLFHGEGLLTALAAGCYEQLFSIEIDPAYVHNARHRFAHYQNIVILEGDSAKVLPELLAKRIDAPATFWLDGHSEGSTPILGELESIRNHPIKTHTILIDDVRCYGTAAHNYVTIDDLRHRLLEINPNYRISFEDGCVENDVMVAKI